MPEFGNPYQEDRKESPGEQGQRYGGTLVQLALLMKMPVTPKREAALRTVAEMVSEWLRPKTRERK